MEGAMDESSALRFRSVGCGIDEADGSFFSVVVADFALEELGMPAFEVRGLLVDSMEGRIPGSSALRFM